MQLTHSRFDPLMINVHLLLHGHDLDFSKTGLVGFVDYLESLRWNITEGIAVEIGLYMISRGYTSLEDLYSICRERSISTLNIPKINSI
jgi:hypothetical protein